MKRPKAAIPPVPGEVRPEGRIPVTNAPYPATQVVFLASLFCQTPLPRSRVDGDRFVRRNWSSWLHIEAGYQSVGGKIERQPVPYGMFARLWLVWMTTQVVRRHGTDVPLGPSVSFLLDQFGLPHDGRRSRMLLKQLYALSGCRMDMGFGSPAFAGYPVEGLLTWEACRGMNPAPGPRLRLAADFAAELRRHAVPLDRNAWLQLRDSSLAFDTYAWLAYRLQGVPPGGCFVSWEQLHFQFGQEYRGADGVRLFRRTFLASLSRVRQAYREAQVIPGDRGLQMYPSPPPIRLTSNPISGMADSRERVRP
jgi:hypothetical protein